MDMIYVLITYNLYFQINPKLSLNKFMPHFCEKVLKLSKNDEILKEDFIDIQLVYCLKIVNSMVDCDGSVLMDYKEILVKVIDRTLDFKCVDVYSVGGNLLSLLLESITSLYEIDLSQRSQQQISAKVCIQVIILNQIKLQITY